MIFYHSVFLYFGVFYHSFSLDVKVPSTLYYYQLVCKRAIVSATTKWRFHGYEEIRCYYGKERFLLYEYIDAEMIIDLRHSFANFHHVIRFQILIPAVSRARSLQCCIAYALICRILMKCAAAYLRAFVAYLFANWPLLTLLRHILVVMQSLVTPAY